MLVMESPSDSRKVGGTENLHLVSGLSTGSHFYSSLSLAANGQSPQTPPSPTDTIEHLVCWLRDARKPCAVRTIKPAGSHRRLAC